MNDSLFQFVEISPDFEKLIMSKAKNQLDMAQSFDCVSGIMSKLSEHFNQISNEISKFNRIIQDFGIGDLYGVVLNSFSQLFDALGRQIIDQSNMGVQIIRKVIFPNIESLTDQYKSSNMSFSKVLEQYSAIEKNDTYEETHQMAESLIKEAKSRSGSLYSLSKIVDICQNCSVSSVGLALTQFISLSSKLFSQYLNDNQNLIQSAESSVTELKSAVQMSLAQRINTSSENEASLSVSKFWEMRLNSHSKVNEIFSKPSGMAWIGNTKTFRQSIWTRKYISYNKGILLAQDPNSIEKDILWPLPLITVNPNDKQRRFCIDIQMPNEKLHIQALSSYDQQEWINTFSNHNISVLGQTTDIKAYKCDDCGSNDSTWISINWGVHLCTKCAGVHRMYSNQSKVRSIVLDDIHPFVFQLFDSLGLGYSNTFLLSKQHKESIDNRTEEALRQIYITRKYIYKEWSRDSKKIDPFKALLKKDIVSLFESIHSGNIYDKDESLTLLHAACSLGYKEAVCLLVFSMKDIDCKDANEWTPLAYATHFQHLEIIEFLMKFGAAVNTTILQIANNTNNEAIIRLYGNKSTELTLTVPFSLKYTPIY